MNNRQLATVLAALRLYQEREPGHCELLDGIATNGGEFEPLTFDEIDTLAAELNTGGSTSFALEREGHNLAGRIDISTQAIEIYFTGYGGTYYSVLIEPADNGHPQVCLYATGGDEPTHDVNFKRAAMAD